MKVSAVFSQEFWAVYPWGPGRYALLASAVFVVLVVRYFVLVSLFQWYFWKRGADRWGARKVYPRGLDAGQARSEIAWSLATCAAYGAIFAGLAYAWREGLTLIYLDPARYGWGYFVASVPIVAVFHETYFYWVHRAMHTDWLYRHVHRVHHQFVTPGPWAAFSFHPLEVVTEHAVLFAIIFLVPLHPIAIVAYLLLMAISGIVNHLGIEIFPKGAGRYGLGGWVIGATHHAQHHRLYHYNYGLYFTFWDRVAGTQHPDFERDYARVTGAAPLTPPPS